MSVDFQVDSKLLEEDLLNGRYSTIRHYHIVFAIMSRLKKHFLTHDNFFIPILKSNMELSDINQAIDITLVDAEKETHQDRAPRIVVDFLDIKYSHNRNVDTRTDGKDIFKVEAEASSTIVVESTSAISTLLIASEVVEYLTHSRGVLMAQLALDKLSVMSQSKPTVSPKFKNLWVSVLSLSYNWKYKSVVQLQSLPTSGFVLEIAPGLKDT
jgi:hypothetical protein